MWALLKPYYIELLEIAWNDGSDTVGTMAGAFDLENEQVQQVLKDLAKRVVGIEETARNDIQSVIGRMASEGLSVESVRDLLLGMAVTSSASRATAIAVTESATAYSLGSMTYYKESGVVTGVEWLTTEGACDICAPLNGRVVKLGDEFAPGISHPSAHPMCRCAVAPRVD